MKVLQLALVTVLLTGLVCGRKLENWHDPEVQGSILPSAEDSARRQPKFFLGTTTTVTSTTSLGTTCFVTVAPINGACAGRKKRAISEEPINESDATPIIKPSAPITDIRQSKALSLNELASVRQGRENVEPRFAIFYLYTTTTTSTVSTFTATTTISLVTCTPASNNFATCV